jgi:hypothetical protein
MIYIAVFNRDVCSMMAWWILVKLWLHFVRIVHCSFNSPNIVVMSLGILTTITYILR